MVALVGICAVHTNPLNDSENEPPSNSDPASWLVTTLTMTRGLPIAVRFTFTAVKFGYGVCDGQLEKLTLKL